MKEAEIKLNHLDLKKKKQQQHNTKDIKYLLTMCFCSLKTNF